MRNRGAIDPTCQTLIRRPSMKNEYREELLLGCMRTSDISQNNMSV